MTLLTVLCQGWHGAESIEEAVRVAAELWVTRMTRHVVAGLHLSQISWEGGTLRFRALAREDLDQIPLQGEGVVDHRVNNGKGHGFIELSRADEIVLVEPDQPPRLGKIES